MAEKTAITISRQFCCGGAKIGNAVAAQLGYHYADREVLHLAAQSLGLPVQEISWRDERLASFWERITELFTYGLPDVSYTAPPFHMVTDQHLFELEARIIQEFAAREDCVIVGRGGVHVLKDHPNVVHIFLHAPVSYRLPTEEKARMVIQESDRARQAYLSRMAKYDWTRSTSYNLCLDTSAISAEQAACVIVQYTKFRQAQAEGRLEAN